MNIETRIKITTSCKDSDIIPKVKNAGDIFTLKNQEYQLMHNGIKTYVDSHYGDFNVEIIKKLKGHHEPQEEKVFYEVLKTMPKKAVMIELGSFWAYYSMWFQKSVEKPSNYMIEPMDYTMQKGISNFKLNNMKGDFTKGCIGRESRDTTQFKHWDGTIHEISQIAIDDFIVRKGIKHINILHADIQSAEYEMLIGAQKCISEGKIDFIFISTHSEGLHRQCLKYFNKKNYNIIAEHSPAESYSIDGLIALHHQSINFQKVNISKRPLSLIDKIIVLLKIIKYKLFKKK